MQCLRTRAPVSSQRPPNYKSIAWISWCTQGHTLNQDELYSDVMYPIQTNDEGRETHDVNEIRRQSSDRADGQFRPREVTIIVVTIYLKSASLPMKVTSFNSDKLSRRYWKEEPVFYPVLF